jgi:hypothetical protein
LFWLGLLALALTALFVLLGLFHWILTAPSLEQNPAQDRFRAEQDYRALQRSGKLPRE